MSAYILIFVVPGSRSLYSVSTCTIKQLLSSAPDKASLTTSSCYPDLSTYAQVPERTGVDFASYAFSRTVFVLSSGRLPPLVGCPGHRWRFLVDIEQISDAPETYPWAVLGVLLTLASVHLNSSSSAT